MNGFAGHSWLTLTTRLTGPVRPCVVDDGQHRADAVGGAVRPLTVDPSS